MLVLGNKEAKKMVTQKARVEGVSLFVEDKKKII